MSSSRASVCGTWDVAGVIPSFCWRTGRSTPAAAMTWGNWGMTDHARNQVGPHRCSSSFIMLWLLTGLLDSVHF